MAGLTRSEVEAIAGKLDEDLIVQIIDSGASAEELTEAFGWFTDSYGMKDAGHHRPTGKVVELCEILESTQTPDEDREQPQES